MTVEIKYKRLWTYDYDDALEEKVPLIYLDDKIYTHIHGELQIIIGERIVPRMGIDSPDDVCLGYWIEMLTNMVTLFKKDVYTYTIEGGDQGKPAYKFEMEGKNVYLSIVDSVLGGDGDPEWQRVRFGYNDFLEAFNSFKVCLLEEIRQQAPIMVDKWSKKFDLKL